jgi:ligand-binding sensor domain-containing protein
MMNLCHLRNLRMVSSAQSRSTSRAPMTDLVISAQQVCGGCKIRARLMPSLRLSVFLLASLVVSSPAVAERLPVRTYATADGLPTPVVLRITRDSRGFLWFGTRDGFSRFDGERFVNYGTRDGLPQPTVNYILETRSGAYLIATNGAGVLQFNLDPARRTSRFDVVRLGDSVAANRVNVLHEDREGRLWAASDGGVFVREPGARDFAARVPSNRPEWRRNASFVAGSADGTVWVATIDGALRTHAGTLQHLRVGTSDADLVRAIVTDSDGSLWIGHELDGLFHVPAAVREQVLDRAAAGIPIATSPLIRHYTGTNGLGDSRVTALHVRSGEVWVGTRGGVSVITAAGSRLLGPEHGLPADRVSWFAEDLAGDLWMATSTGAHKITSNGLTTFDRTSGLPSDHVHAIYPDSEDGIHVVSDHYVLSRFEGARFTAHSGATAAIPNFAWQSQVAYLARDGSWWLLTPRGVARIPAHAVETRDAQRAATWFTRERGLATDNAYRAYETASGAIWVAGQGGGLARWEPGKPQFTVVADIPLSAGPITALGGDARGNLWVGLMSGTLARIGNAGVTWFDARQHAPAAPISAFHSDAHGRLWIGTTAAGVMRIDDPSGAALNAVRYTTSEGLGSDNVRCITDDEEGRLYFGTVRGVDRLDVPTGRVRHFTTSDWVGSRVRHRSRARSIGRALVRHDVRRLQAAPVTRCRSSCATHLDLEPENRRNAASGGGARRGPDRRTGPAAWAGCDRDGGWHDLGGDGRDGSRAVPARRFGQRMEPAHAGPPLCVRSPGAGGYRFEIRAIAADGTVSAVPAVLALRVLPPFWARPWFVSLAVAGMVLGAYQAHRIRVRRVVELERVRMRIAADLHDDIGSNLSKITLLSEILKREVPPQQQDARTRIASIARVANDSIDAMADIVWAIDPSRDYAGDLVQRMRRHAGDTLGAAGITLDSRLPAKRSRCCSTATCAGRCC